MLKIEERHCTVCGSDQSTIRNYGGRHYCDTHLHMLYEDSRQLWQACILTFGSIIFAIVVSSVFSIIAGPELAGTPHFIPGIIASVFPGIVWITSIYRYAARWQSDLSPLIPVVVITGILSAAAVSHPYFNNLIALSTWLSKTTALNRLVGNTLLGGFFHAFIVYLIVRIAAWTHSSFRRRVTGIELTMAATIGYSTTLSVLYVLDYGGLLVLSGTLRLVSMFCSLIAPSLILGYFIGICRFEDLAFMQLVLGFAACAGLYGLMTYISSETGYVGLSLTQDGFSPWPGAVICILITVATFIAVYGLIQRQNHLAQARIEPSR